MPTIELLTNIRAPKELVFDLARSIDLHKISTQQTDEEAIAGVTSGLIGLGEWGNMESEAFRSLSKIDI